jgi:hypothetical protein
MSRVLEIESQIEELHAEIQAIDLQILAIGSSVRPGWQDTYAVCIISGRMRCKQKVMKRMIARLRLKQALACFINHKA